MPVKKKVVSVILLNDNGIEASNNFMCVPVESKSIVKFSEVPEERKTLVIKISFIFIAIICEKKKKEMINDDFDYILEQACEEGNIKLVKIIIKKGSENFNCGFFRACEKGHLEIIKLFIKKGVILSDYSLFLAKKSGSDEIKRLFDFKKNW